LRSLINVFRISFSFHDALAQQKITFLLKKYFPASEQRRKNNFPRRRLHCAVTDGVYFLWFVTLDSCIWTPHQPGGREKGWTNSKAEEKRKQLNVCAWLQPCCLQVYPTARAVIAHDFWYLAALNAKLLLYFADSLFVWSPLLSFCLRTWVNHALKSLLDAHLNKYFTNECKYSRGGTLLTLCCYLLQDLLWNHARGFKSLLIKNYLMSM